MHKATDIAHVFIQRSIDDERPLTHMKLQKMVYFAHGLYLAAHDVRPLIVDTVEAWQYGPVIPSIYYKYSSFGDQAIVNGPKLESLGFFSESIPVFDTKSLEAIDESWESLKKVSAIQLSNWTHKDGSAWSKSYKPGIRHIPIPNELIAVDFEPFIEK